MISFVSVVIVGISDDFIVDLFGSINASVVCIDDSDDGIVITFASVDD